MSHQLHSPVLQRNGQYGVACTCGTIAYVDRAEIDHWFIEHKGNA